MSLESFESGNGGESDKLLCDERRKTILRRVNAFGKVTVSDLAQEFSISPVTVRNDLKVLEEQGSLERTHGGALRIDTALIDRALQRKEQMNPEEKSAIAEAASSLILDGYSVILDSGSTTAQIARTLADRGNLTVITNAANISFLLMESPGIEVILTGGVLRRNSDSLVGHLAEESLERLTADIFFLGVDGIDEDIGFTTPNLAEARVNQVMRNVARKTIVVSDSSKFGKRSLAVICDLEGVDGIITDSALDSSYRRKIDSLDIDLTLVDPKGRRKAHSR